MNGNVRLTREYLPPEHYLQKNLFPRIESDDALKVNELTEAITEYYSEKIRSLANLKEHPIQEMTSEMLASWQRDMQNYSDALRLFSGDTSLKKIQESKLYYDINLCKISDFINELENINKYTVIENISGYATNGLFNGEVEITSSNSKSYFKGLYSNGLKNGCGIEISPNGDIYEGEFVNGYKCGRGRLIKADEILAGIFINGKYRADTIFNDFKGPEFWIGYNDELGKVIFAPRDGPNGPGCRFMLVTTPDNWDVIQIEASRLGNPIRKHMEALTDEAKGQLEKQLELWKIEFREYGFIKIYSKLLPYHLTEEIEMEEYQLYIVNYKIELTSAKEFLKATKDERVSIISDLLEGYEYDPFDSYW